MDFPLPSEGRGQGFESLRARHFGTKLGTPAGLAPPPITNRSRTVLRPIMRISASSTSDLIDDRAEIGAPEGRIAGQNIAAHDLDRGSDFVGRDTVPRARFGEGAVIGGSGRYRAQFSHRQRGPSRFDRSGRRRHFRWRPRCSVPGIGGLDRV
jgi:hypothetical protein